MVIRPIQYAKATILKAVAVPFLSRAKDTTIMETNVPMPQKTTDIVRTVLVVERNPLTNRNSLSKNVKKETKKRDDEEA